MRIKPLKPALNALMMGCFLLNADAQKLPNVQMESVRAPVNIKIDGKATEWDEKFQAYNHATDIFYTISNDDSKLYLTVQVADRSVINKIVRGGITFTIQKSGKKVDKGGASITYPLFDKIFQVISADSQRPAQGDSVKQSNNDKALQSDSMMMVYNHKLALAGYIGVTGIKTLDTLMSVYNTDGIKTAQMFDNKIQYTYELAIDLKLLGLRTSDAAKFAYHIAINPFSLFTIPDSAPKRALVKAGLGFVMADDAMFSGPEAATTDTWGEYTLAKL